MKRWILICALALNTTQCGPKQTAPLHSKLNQQLHQSNSSLKAKTDSKDEVNLRGIASLKTQLSGKALIEFRNIMGVYPSSFIAFMNNQPQRVKLEPTLKQYADIIPKDIFLRMMSLAKKVDDSGMSITRQGGDLIITNANAEFKTSFAGPIGNLSTKIDGKSYDFANPKILSRYITELEKNILNAKQALLYNRPATAQFGIFKQCQLLQLAFFPQESQAIANGWFILGGMALIAVAIAVAASRMTKNLKKTEHTIIHDVKTKDLNINVNDVGVNVGVNDNTINAIDNFGDKIKDIDPTIFSNNTIVTPSLNSPVDGLDLTVDN